MSQKPTAVALDQVEVVPAHEAPTCTWIRVDWDDGDVEAGPDAAVYFPPGFSYQVTAVSPDPVFLAYTLYPASR
jgi:hypothetical protein